MDSLLNEIKHIDASDKAVLGFGRVFGVIGLLVSGFILYRTGFPGTMTAWLPVAIGLVLFVTARFVPLVLRPVFRVWMLLAVLLGFVMTRVILFIVFAIVVTPTGLIMRALGRDPLQKEPDPSRQSYWIPKEPSEDASERFRRLY